jgi:hypothetical protein
MRFRTVLLGSVLAMLGGHAGFSDILSSQLGAPFAVQPGAGLVVTGGVSQGFFSDLTGLTFPGPGIVDVLSNVLAFDSLGDPITSFQVTSVEILQGTSESSEAVEPFDLPSATTYSSTLNPFDQVTVDPANLNLAFSFDLGLSQQYTYMLDVTGVPDGGFLLYDDVEGALVPAQVPEPDSALLMLCGLAAIAWRVRAIRDVKG